MATVEHESRQPLKGNSYFQWRSSHDTSQLRAPFSVEVFAHIEGPVAKTEAHFASLLPATHRNENDDLECPRGGIHFLEQELHVDAIDRQCERLALGMRAANATASTSSPGASLTPHCHHREPKSASRVGTTADLYETFAKIPPRCEILEDTHFGR